MAQNKWPLSTKFFIVFIKTKQNEMCLNWLHFDFPWSFMPPMGIPALGTAKFSFKLSIPHLKSLPSSTCPKFFCLITCHLCCCTLLCCRHMSSKCLYMLESWHLILQDHLKIQLDIGCIILGLWKTIPTNDGVLAASFTNPCTFIL